MVPKLPKAKSVIAVSVFGGIPNTETFDPKPKRKKAIVQYKIIPTNVPGIEVTEMVPKLAKIADKYSILRTVTGFTTAGHDKPMQAFLCNAPEPVAHHLVASVGENQVSGGQHHCRDEESAWTAAIRENFLPVFTSSVRCAARRGKVFSAQSGNPITSRCHPRQKREPAQEQQRATRPPMPSGWPTMPGGWPRPSGWPMLSS